MAVAVVGAAAARLAVEAAVGVATARREWRSSDGAMETESVPSSDILPGAAAAGGSGGFSNSEALAARVVPIMLHLLFSVWVMV